MAFATALVASLALAPATPAQAEPWSWDAPADCPGARTVRAAVQAQLDAPLSERPVGTWSVLGTITHDDDTGYAIALVIETPDGRHDRLLTDPGSCATLSSSAALLIAMALSADPDMPDALEPESEPVPPQAEPAPPPSEADVESALALEPLAVEPADTPPSPEPLTFAISVAPGLDWGTLRDVTPAGQLSLAWQPRRLRVGLAAHFGGNPSFSLPPLSARIRLWRWSLAAQIGPVPSLGRFEFPLLVGIEAGQVLLTPRVLLPAGSQAAWAALIFLPGVAWVPRRWLALIAQTGTTVALTRPTFAVSGLDPILRPSRVGVRAFLGVEFRVPLMMKTPGRGNQPSSP